MRSFHLRVRGVELACEEHGEGARALVLVHGYTGSRRDFAWVAPALAAHERRVIVIEQRGHGRSTWLRDDEAYTLDALTHDLGAALDALELDRVDLVGHSMGGQVALRLALDAPHRVRSLALVSTWGGCIDVFPKPPLHSRVIDAFPLLRQAADAYHRTRGRQVPAAPLDVDPHAYRALPRTMRAADLRGRLTSLHVPTRVIVGGADARFVPHAAALARVIPDATLTVIDHAGHQVMTERPRAFVDVLEPHLAAS
ncbi:alpha/beta fold hydrolase [Sandaracinus amylolyticus]|uniref:alpha/beta fold hydrolase n=1 Tax=Sandaracinus amylolyticus TaxID=927083 RepID=UPI001F198CC6|nr:alpha/beta fold hydrolase [Sandaracinus amylolyticus]UJR83404.1 Hypothetical protein I5071_54720 [Sandaracinus amylolyticus]